MADKNPKSESQDGKLLEPSTPQYSEDKPKSADIPKGKPIADPLLQFLSAKEKSLGYPITERTISLLRREISKNPNSKIEDIWRRIYG